MLVPVPYNVTERQSVEGLYSVQRRVNSLNLTVRPTISSLFTGRTPRLGCITAASPIAVSVDRTRSLNPIEVKVVRMNRYFFERRHLGHHRRGLKCTIMQPPTVHGEDEVGGGAGDTRGIVTSPMAKTLNRQGLDKACRTRVSSKLRANAETKVNGPCQ